MGDNGEGCTLGDLRTERGPAVICAAPSCLVTKILNKTLTSMSLNIIKYLSKST